ncbi:hypothetical protein FE782_29580 [Paenibacillus antri]|uniref:Uncharacterized protein n=1 Tax=Paenibacillus antri TaxID=2582848 RepID=A0A5R9G512_9BACL|nr:hypothetical protein [Paenibacillus antri]TLS48578.1 hypothetical protein FE782_29580 [Paenibacillus antri]
MKPEDAEVTVVAMQAVTPANEKVIYQYKLLKRIRRHPLISLVYLGFLILWLSIVPIFQGEANLLLWGIGALIGWQAAYYVLTTALLRREREELGYSRRYGWLLAWPWFGYLPTSSVPFRQYRSIQLHMTAIGVLATAGLAVWVPLAAALTAGFVHLWWMAPRLYLSMAMKRSAQPGSIVAMTAADVGLYSP